MMINSDLCVSFAESLELLRLDNKAGAYGFLPQGHCDAHWKVYRREGWLNALRTAQTEIASFVKAPLCAQDVCDEMHQLSSQITMNHRPIAYLGTREYGEWAEEALTIVTDGSGGLVEGYVDICEAQLGEADLDHLQFSYADETLACFNGLQALQEPCVETLVSGEDEEEWPACVTAEGETYYRFTWPAHQLVKPDVDKVQPNDASGLIDAVKWRTWQIDEAAAVEVVTVCGCGSCQSGLTQYVASICDATLGVICISQSGRCLTGHKRIRLNYGTAYECRQEGMNPSLQEAVVLLAISKLARSPIKPCGCDNSWIDYLTEDDPSAQREFASKLRFGPTRAGMMVMRMLSNYIESPTPSSNVRTGGFFTARRPAIG